MAFIHSDKKIVVKIELINSSYNIERQHEVETDCGNVDIGTSQYVRITGVNDYPDKLDITVQSLPTGSDNQPAELIVQETMCKDTKWLDVKTY